MLKVFLQHQVMIFVNSNGNCLSSKIQRPWVVQIVKMFVWHWYILKYHLMELGMEHKPQLGNQTPLLKARNALE